MSSDEHYLKAELYSRLRNDPKLFEWIEQGSLDGLWYWDLENPEHEWLSPKFKTLFGYEEDEIPHTSTWWQENIFQDDLPKVLENFNKHCEDLHHPYDQIVRYRHRQGHTIWVRCRGLVMLDADGKPIRMIGAHTDVTALMESKQQVEDIKQELHEANNVLQLAVKTSKLGIWEWNPTTDTLSWNDEMFQIFEIDRDDFKSEYQDWANCVHVDDLQQTETLFQLALENKGRFETKYRIVCVADGFKWVYASAEVSFDEDGKPTKVVGINQDITDEETKRRQLERSNADLSSFAYVASHDLKSPLRGIKQLATWIQEDLSDISPATNENLDLMHSRITRMERLLEDLLDYSRIENVDDEKKPHSLDSIILDSYNMLDKPEDYTLNFAPSGLTLALKKTPFEQVIRNLFSNAIKHNDRQNGCIDVEINDHRHYVEIVVSDDGPGIEARYQETIFKMFQTLKPRDKVEGSGMGLAIVKKILETNDGSIVVESPIDESRGTRFTITWPK